jgi:hypothetical protein
MREHLSKSYEAGDQSGAAQLLKSQDVIFNKHLFLFTALDFPKSQERRIQP